MSQDRAPLATDDQHTTRCRWCVGDPRYIEYHDAEWGRPLADDRRLFEKLCLEGFQCGLSWLTILRKRPRFREVFDEFDFVALAGWSETRIEQARSDPGIVRHAGKIRSVVNNARRTLEIVESGESLGAFLWGYAPEQPARAPASLEHVPTTTDHARRLSRDLKRRGFSFVGPTTSYALMQASGMVNDHLVGCDFRAPVDRAQRAFERPVA